MRNISILIISILITSVAISQNQGKTMKNILTAYEFKTRYTTVDHMEIAYVKKGRGRTTLLFLHGLSSNSDAWSKNIETLKSQYNCVAIDLPGFGKSSKTDAPYTPSFFAEVVHKFIKKLRLKNVVLIGHSMGGQAAIKLAAAHPATIRKLILVAPAGLETFTRDHATLIKNTYTEAMVANTSDGQITKNYQLNFFNMPGEVSKMIEDRKRIKTATDFNAHCRAIVKSISGMLDEPVFELLGNIPHHTLVIFGENDMLIPNRYLNPGLSVAKVGNIALEKIRNASLEFIPGSGHFVQFEKPGEVNTLIQEFVENKR